MALCVVLVGPPVRAGGPFVFAVVGLVVFTLFWWFTMWLLLAGRIPWRRLLPPAVALAVADPSWAFTVKTCRGGLTAAVRE